MRQTQAEPKAEHLSEDHLRSRVAALEELLEVYEAATFEQGQRLQNTIAALNERAAQLAQSEQHLQAQTNILKSILDSMADGVVVMDTGERVLLVNPAANRIVGMDLNTLSPEQLSSFGVFSSDHLSPIPANEFPIRRGIAGEQLNDIEIVLKSPVGRDQVWISVNVRPLVNPSGEITGAVCVFRDVTERKRVQEQLQHQSRELARSNSELEQFAYVASHDLQEPLRMVTGFAQLLARRYKGKLDQDADEFIGYITGAVNRMQQLINDLLTYSRVGSRPKEFKIISMDSVLRHAMGNLAVAMTERRAEVTSDPLPYVLGDELQLVDLLQNLISNAIKFTSTNLPRVHVSAHRQHSQVTFSVQDNGIGIDPKYQDKIFVIFQRLHTAAEYPGTGIGLAICKKIVERHGGRIWFDSDQATGTTFRFTLTGEGGSL